MLEFEFDLNNVATVVDVAVAVVSGAKTTTLPTTSVNTAE